MCAFASVFVFCVRLTPRDIVPHSEGQEVPPAVRYIQDKHVYLDIKGSVLHKMFVSSD